MADLEIWSNVDVFITSVLVISKDFYIFTFLG